MSNPPDPTLRRRDVLRVLVIGTGAAAASAVGIAEVAADSFTDEQKNKPRYRVTDDVKAFYRVNRY
jgi:hypothetical protein